LEKKLDALQNITVALCYTQGDHKYNTVTIFKSQTVKWQIKRSSRCNFELAERVASYMYVLFE